MMEFLLDACLAAYALGAGYLLYMLVVSAHAEREIVETRPRPDREGTDD